MKDRKILLILLIMGIILNVFLFSSIRKNQKIMASNSYEKGNMFYIQLMNYCMPAVKVLNFQDEDMLDSTFSLKNVVLNTIGFDINKPEKIVNSEVAYLYEEPSYSSPNKVESFTLNKKDIKDINENSSDGSNNKSIENTSFQVYDPKLKKTLNVSKPEVLIYHSHTTESYSPYGTDSMDQDKNVCAVGEVIAKELENNYGIAVIHDTTVHNAAAYTQSYQRSGETVDKYLSKYGDFKMLIDLHRDSSPDKSALTMKINGESVAKFMFVMARKNPHYNKNIALVNSVISTANKDFPGLCTGIYYYDYGTNFFNQAKSNNAFLLEVGSDVNSIDEAKATGKYIARILAEVLNKSE